MKRVGEHAVRPLAERDVGDVVVGVLGAGLAVGARAAHGWG